MYRILAAHGETQERRRQPQHPGYVKPQLRRCVVGWTLARRPSAAVARHLLRQTLDQHKVTKDRAFAANPERFVNGPPQVTPLPEEVWINGPPADEKTEVLGH